MKAMSLLTTDCTDCTDFHRLPQNIQIPGNLFPLNGINYYMKSINNLSYKIIGCAFKIHSRLGPGLLESAYETCLEYELRMSGLDTERQKALPLVYDQIKLDAGYRIDLIVHNSIILEIKAVDAIAPIHKAQVMTYLKLSGFKLGLLLNFNVIDMKEGIHRIIM